MEKASEYGSDCRRNLVAFAAATVLSGACSDRGYSRLEYDETGFVKWAPDSSISVYLGKMPFSDECREKIMTLVNKSAYQWNDVGSEHAPKFLVEVVDGQQYLDCENSELIYDVNLWRDTVVFFSVTEEKIHRQMSDNPDVHAITSTFSSIDTSDTSQILASYTVVIDEVLENYCMEDPGAQRLLPVIVLHEFGHILGLGHAGGVMTETVRLPDYPEPYVNPETEGAGLRAIYGD